MRRAVLRICVLAAAVLATIRVLMRRPFRGPTRPGWTWSEELLVAITRATMTTIAGDLDLMSRRGDGLNTPLDRDARRALTVEEVDLGGIRAERYRPKTLPSGTILRFHGGGFVSGSVGAERRVAAQLALRASCDTYGVRYRLAPNHPYPAALDDAVTAYRGLLERGTDPATTIFFGGSAGACLALAALLKLRELQLPQPAGAVLLWPYADFTFSGETIETNGDIDMLPVRDLAHVWGPAYVGDADPADPLVSPALADLTGLPPLLIIAGGAESLLSCAERIAANARSAGIDTRFTVYPDKVHGWMMLPKLPATVQAVDELTQWIATRLAS
jgi:salicylate hydroxylase